MLRPIMSKQTFKRVALIGRLKEGVTDTLLALKHHLEKQHVSVVVEQETASLLNNEQLTAVDQHELNQHSDLIIVVGGDGSLLHAAKIAVDQDLPVLGINRGRLGFLTDVKPDQLELIDDVLRGDYQQEARFLLKAQYNSHSSIALNDVVLMPGMIAHMIEFEIYIDGDFVCNQRADGLIVATPTGSTAYSLSGGGPILYPSLDAIVLVPMSPHTLTSRPIVIKGDSRIEIVICQSNDHDPCLSADGSQSVCMPPGSKFSIYKYDKYLKLIHPKDYKYFDTLRTKLRWQSKS